MVQGLKITMVKCIYAIIFLVAIVSCNTMQDEPSIIIENVLTVDTIPSGSGIAVIKDSVFIVGDDSPWLFQLSSSLQEVNRFRMVEGFQDEGRIPKAVKPDFECLAEFEMGGEHFLLAFGSGSISPERDVLVKVNIANPGKPEVYSLTAFYNYLLEETGSSRAAMNMEAALVLENQLYLFNRGNNGIFVLKLEDFLACIQKGKEGAMPEFRHYPFKLPLVEGISAGFSGACALPDSSKILFTATLEATENWIADGEIMGSYLGVLDVTRLSGGEVERIALVKDSNGKGIKDKLESVAVIEQGNDGGFMVLSVADNDDGTSKLLKLRLGGSFF